MIVLRDMAILSLVGKQMKNMVGIAGRMFTSVFSSSCASFSLFSPLWLWSAESGADTLMYRRTLAEGNINIEMISQGSSEIK